MIRGVSELDQKHTASMRSWLYKEDFRCPHRGTDCDQSPLRWMQGCSESLSREDPVLCGAGSGDSGVLKHVNFAVRTSHFISE